MTTHSPDQVHEAYAFACMRCGHGWEQDYEIEHYVRPDGGTYVTYRTGGQTVPSPLSRPTCLHCGSHVVRIMRPGAVHEFDELLQGSHQAPGHHRHWWQRATA
ncbi:hypothetical protein [Streptomyces sp. NPDC056600]|uniref:hypothetical protein n=1 Tax=Streptomyces sp. NPDC056600 TaxID=3345874 RepID=UPI0036B69F92